MRTEQERAARREERRRARLRAQGIQPVKTCQQCGSSFTDGGYKYCSDECRKRAHRANKTAKQREYNARPGAAEANRQRSLERSQRPGVRERNRERQRRRRQENPDLSWSWNLRYVHGMTPDQWHAWFVEHRGLCYLGGHPLPGDRKKIVIDHDHSHCGPERSCGICRRGLACSNCNTLIGLASDDPQLLRTIAANLERQLAITKALIMAAPEQGRLFDLR